MRAIILPGNGDGDVRRSNWYKWLEGKLLSSAVCSDVILKNMPDPVAAKRSIWLPFVLSLGAGPDTMVIGHSSGAVAAMRLLEDHKLAGVVLVSSCHTDLGDASERASGYYPPSGGEWQWEKIRANAGIGGGNIRILHSDDDCFIPLAEAQHVADSLRAPLHVAQGRSHFFEPYEPIFEAASEVIWAASAAAAKAAKAASPMAEPLAAGGEDESQRLEVGARVVLQGLASRPELNGCEGVVLGTDEATGRYKVKVKRLEGDEAVKLKPACVAPADVGGDMGAHMRDLSL